MSRKKKEFPIIEQIEITDVAAEGKAIARYNDLVIFVPYVAPGDVVDLQLYRKKNRYAEGRVLQFHRYSPLRVEPFVSISVYAEVANGSIFPMKNS